MRGGDAPVGMHQAGTDRDGGILFAPENGREAISSRPSRRRWTPSKKAHFDWQKSVNDLRGKLTEGRLETLATTTGIPASAWVRLGPGWADAADLRVMKASGAGWREQYPDGAFVLVEHRGDGRLAGVSLRTVEGRKGSPSRSVGASRGIIVPNNLHDLPDPVLAVEGATDVAACCSLGIAAVGRPSNRAGAADLAVLLDGRDVLVVGERDGKPGGSWPGRDGAKSIAQQLAGRLNEPVQWTLPPMDAKDIREWIVAKIADGLDLTDVDAVRYAREELLTALRESAKAVKPTKRSQADALVDLALARFRLGVSERGDAFAVEHEGPALALMFRGGATALRSTLARMFRHETGKTPSTSALSDAMTALEGMATDSVPEVVALRIAEQPSDNMDDVDESMLLMSVVLDLGDSVGSAVEIRPGNWEMKERSPVLFHRTALTGALPVPMSGGDETSLLALRDLLNVSDGVWPLLVGWLVASYFPAIPHPVLMLGGEQGTGKSSAARMIVNLIDPSPALLRSQPRDVEQWAIAAAGSWAVVIDNVSHIPAWWSDALCKAVTGDGWIRRKLYTDSDLAVLTFRRCIVLTSIDAGALRGDLGDRLLLIDLEPIGEANRRTEAELDAEYCGIHPVLLAGLLTAVAKTRAVLPTVDLEVMPRMADFARVLSALDQACPDLTGGQALSLFMAQRGRIAGDVVDADPVAAAIVNLVEHSGQWSGTAAKLLSELTPQGNDGNRLPKSWPKTPQAMGGAIKRATPALRAVGIEVERDRDTDRNRNRRWTFRRTGRSDPDEGDSHQNVQHVRTSEDCEYPDMLDVVDNHMPDSSGEVSTMFQPKSIRQKVADMIRQARRSQPDVAVELRDTWRERRAICVNDGGLQIDEAEAIAMKEMKAVLDDSQVLE